MTQKQRLLRLLSDGAWHHFEELQRIGWRYSARLHDLKNDGFDHEIKKDGRVVYYRFTEDTVNKLELIKNFL